MQYTPAGDAILASLTPGSATASSKVIQAMYGAWTFRQTANTWHRSSDAPPDFGISPPVETSIFSPHKGMVESSRILPDGKYLLVGSSGDKHLVFWDIASRETFKFSEGILFMALVICSIFAGWPIYGYEWMKDDARIWDVATGRTLHVLTGHHNLAVRVAFSPDGKYVLPAALIVPLACGC
jgi:WD40 repeat protein